jgi:hypothetical protein
VQILKIAPEVCLIGLARQTIHAGRRVLPKLAERFRQQFRTDVVEQRSELLRLPFPYCLPYPIQRL